MKKNTGFTLVEVMVVTAIIALSALLFITRQRSPEKDLENNRKQMISVIEQARNYAISGYNIPSGIVGYGYGVVGPWYEENKYILYLDINGNYKYDGPMNDSDIEIYYLDNKTNIQRVSGLHRDIVFSLYEGKAYADGAQFTSDYNFTLVSTVNSALTKNITINGVTSQIR
ncbi:MAG: prepilin-type N-terminal cleavage/methylation domain-containing protein [Patescibacteria group bacterium]|jgi:prepilin-type N-terminal cleavage/methylation domain-containing protein